MIRLCKPADLAALAAFCGNTLPGCYILSRFSCYGNDYDFCKCYVDETDGVVKTALSVLDGTAVLLTGARTDFEELALCLPVFGVRVLLCSANAGAKLPFPVLQQKTAFCLQTPLPAADACGAAPMRDVYDLISAAIPGSFPAEKDAYLRFLSDFTFRQNRGKARLKAVVENETLCACALTAAESDGAAVLSGVACRADCRGRGFGKTVVSALAHALQQAQKFVHVIALNDSACGFYRTLGFDKEETIIWLDVK